jgi:chemotaxis protein CheC
MNLRPEHIDALKELINIGVGRAAGVLNQMVHSHIVLQIPMVRVLTVGELRQVLPGMVGESVAAVQLGFEGDFEGEAELIFPPASAMRLVSLLTGEQEGSVDLDAARAGTLNEVGNIVLNGVMGSVVNVLHQRLTFGLPTYFEDRPEHLIGARDDREVTVVLATARFGVVDCQIEGDILVVFETGAFDRLIVAIDKTLASRT